MKFYAYGTAVLAGMPWQFLPPAPPDSAAVSVQVDRVAILPAPEIPVAVRPLQGRSVAFSGTFPDILIRVDDLLAFSLHEDQRRIVCLARTDASQAMLDYWLLRQVLPMARFFWNEVEILH